MPTAPSLRHALLDDTAAALGRDYLQQLVNSLARHSGAQLVFISQQLPLPVRHVAVMVASSHRHPGRYALAGTPCEQVISRQQAIVHSSGVNRHFAAEQDTAWQSFAGWPLLDKHGHCMGHLALFDERANLLPDTLLQDIAPFVTRAAAELQRLEHERISSSRASWDALHSHFLRQYIQGQPLPTLLGDVVGHIEQALPGWLCSILQVDDTQCLRPLVGPSLPQAYTALIDGLAIGPMVGSCGAAAWHRKRLVAEDLQQHPNWAPYREQARQFALGSCWSEPIIDSKGKVHGTFAVYHHAPSAPTLEAITVIEDTARLLAVLMENDANRQALDSRTQWYQAILQNAADALSIIDMEGCLLEASDSLCKLLGYSQAELRQLRLWDLVAHRSEAELREQLQYTSEQGETFDSYNRTKDGDIIEVEVCVRRLMLDGQPVIWGSARDISLRKQQERQLREQATIDSLTGLYNRPTLLGQLDALLASPSRPGLALLMLDLDHFKQVNDSYGHACGDATLAHIASQLRQLLGPQDCAGRLGGEEFCILLPGTTPQAAQRYSQRLLDTIAQQPLQFTGQTIALTASIGLALLEPGDDSRSLLARADMALYQAKHQGRNRMVMLPP
ncbi:diguanylate cyclase [Vogesella sp. DC21W]|uniref:Diguanylate cyclase n=1 Tax=Vogesella aquatica TaxID=2984206 RepID=A0ABT5IWR8_9NEIS|nr:diguanylate cyclase [Vogesella aquatica]MDC7716994.1 diguanylate cyclase [Vogesella aquatica]